MNALRGLLLAALLAGAAAPALAASAGIDIRTDDTVVLKDSGERLVGEIVSQNDRELSIKLKEYRGAIRTVPMANVARILRRQNIKQAFEARLKECADAKDAAGLHALAAEVLRLNPGMVDEAISALNSACALKPDLGPAHLLLGRLYLGRGSVRKAGEEGAAAAKAMPKDAAAQALLGTALVRQGEIKKGVAALETALSLAPAADVRTEVAAALAEAGETDRAQKLLEKLTETDPSAQLASGVAWLRAGDLNRAAGQLDKAARSLKAQGEPHLALAATYFLQGETDKAAAEVGEMPTYGDARDAAPLALKGLIALRRGELDKADGFIKRATVADPNRGRVAAARAVLEIARSNLAEAAQALETPAADPGCNDAYVHYLLGYVRWQMKEPSRALTSYVRAAELAPGWLDALLGAGSAALAARSYSAAERHFSAAAKLAPDSTQAHAGLGLACLGLAGRDDDAEKELRRALALDGRSVSANLGLGFLANRRGRETDALAAFERAIGLDGSNAFAADALAKLRSGRGEEVEYFPFDGPGLPTGWAQEQLYGVQVAAADGRVLLSGKQARTAGRDTRFYVRMEPGKFARLDLDVECSPTGGLVAGIYLGTGAGEIELAMTETGRIGWRTRSRSGWSANGAFTDVGDWPKGELGAAGKVRLAIESVDPERGAFRLYAGGRPVTDKEIVVDTLGRSPGFSVGAFCRAQLGDEVRVGLDNACLVTRRPKADEK